MDFRARIWNPGLPWFLRSRFQSSVSGPLVSSPSLLLPHDHLVHHLPVSLVSTFFCFLSAAPGFTCLPYHSLSDSSWGPGPPSHLIKDDFSFMIKFKTPPISGVSHYQPEHKGLVSPTPMLPKSLTEMKIPSTDDLAAMSIDKLGSSWPVGWLVGWLVDDHCERRPASPPTSRLTHRGCCALHLVDP